MRQESRETSRFCVYFRLNLGSSKRRIVVGDIIKKNLNPDGIDRRGFLQCMAWAGTGPFA
jgi:hypothetical protein